MTFLANRTGKPAEIPPPPIGSPMETTSPALIIPLGTPPPQRSRMIRRNSMSGTERRAATPLTPPRRISGPLELFIAQSSLKKLKNPNSAINALPPKPPQTASTHSMPAKVAESPKRPPKPKARAEVGTPKPVPEPPSPEKKLHYSSPRTRHEMNIDAEWKTINLPDKTRIKGPNDDAGMTKK
jgi:hypothetical protein